MQILLEALSALKVAFAKVAFTWLTSTPLHCNGRFSSLAFASSPLSRPMAPAATIPTSQTQNESTQCATAPVENFPPCASPPGHTPPTAVPHRSAAQAAARTSPSHPPCAQSAKGSSPSRSCTPETHPPPPADHHLSSSCCTAAQIHLFISRFSIASTVPTMRGSSIGRNPTSPIRRHEASSSFDPYDCTKLFSFLLNPFPQTSLWIISRFFFHRFTSPPPSNRS